MPVPKCSNEAGFDLRNRASIVKQDGAACAARCSVGMSMATAAEKTAFTAFRRIVSELRKADKSFGRQSPQFKYLMDQMRDHQVTQRVYSKAPEEAEHVANLYTTYLSSTRALTQLESRYSRGERSVEESARLVGLALPKTKY